MQMQLVKGGLVIPAGSAVQLLPGGMHIMLINLAVELKAGDTIEITVKFNDDTEQTLTVPVRDIEEEGMAMGSDNG
jgi:copper(I)-binding protein